jgi:EAL domain-containing protein (putative c-di-GMP-specific phosphodiesterase class I)
VGPARGPPAPEDTAARTGGDEFMVLIGTVTSTDEALAVADRIAEALAPPFRAGDSELYLTASACIARALELACTAAAGWKPLQVCVNVSGRQLQQPDMQLVGEVAAALDGAGLAAASLCLEITESAVMRDVDRALLTLRELKRLGVSIALDDFGKGYSSLSYLRRFPLDIVKIDREFVHELDHADGQAIVRALIDVSHALRATVLGEGIETTAQAATLRRMGCDLGQGFCFSPPLPPDGVERLLAEGGSLLPAELRT